VWGLLVVQHCSMPRRWQEVEISLLSFVVTELTTYLQPFTFQSQLEKLAQEALKQTERERAIARTIDKIRQSSDINTIFRLELLYSKRNT